MPSHGAFESIPTQPGPFAGWEERIIVGACPLPEPDLQNLESFPSQRGAALLAPLSLATNVGSGAGHDIAAAQVDQLGCSQSGLEGNDVRFVPCLQPFDRPPDAATTATLPALVQQSFAPTKARQQE